MFKTLFICFAAVAVASADKHADAGEAVDAAAPAGLDISAMIGPFLEGLGIDAETTAALKVCTGQLLQC